MKLKSTNAWAVALEDDNYFIPDFNIDDKMENIMQIHSTRKSAENVAKKCGKGWKVVKALIVIEYE